MSLKIQRYVNQLMTSNCYIVVDVESNHCICIDPASEKSEREIEYIEKNKQTLDYIILTHEHTDHTWGVNALLDYFLNTKVVCSSICKDNLARESQAYFRFYYNNCDYHYEVKRVDIITDVLNEGLLWCGHRIKFINTPGHSMGSICVDLEGCLFSGDTIMQVKPFVNKRNGSKKAYGQSVCEIKNNYSTDTIIYPGHGDDFILKEWKYETK